MHDMLFDNQNQWNKLETNDVLFASYVLEIQLDQEIFDSCLTSGKYIERLERVLTMVEITEYHVRLDFV